MKTYLVSKEDVTWRITCDDDEELSRVIEEGWNIEEAKEHDRT